MITQGKLEHYVNILKNQHYILEQEIHDGQKNYMPDLELEELKKKRLAIKDAITSIEKDIH